MNDDEPSAPLDAFSECRVDRGLGNLHMSGLDDGAARLLSVHFRHLQQHGVAGVAS
jgi:hypothetical protein